MRVFITGATGFVGGHVARQYATGGASLRLLTRQTSRLDSLSGINAEMVKGDLREPEKLRSALMGCDALVHVAADYRLWVRDPEQMYAANVDGTRELLKLAREVGIQRVVYTSSVATMGFKADGTIVNEDTPVALSDMIGHVQTIEVPGRAGGHTSRKGRPACHYSESYDPDRCRRRQADADRQDHRRFPEQEVSCICGYWIEPRRRG